MFVDLDKFPLSLSAAVYLIYAVTAADTMSRHADGQHNDRV